MPIGIGAGIIGSSVISGLLGGLSGSSRKQSKAADAAINEQTRQFNKIMKMMAPYQAFGEAALPELQALLGLGDITYQKGKRTITLPAAPGSPEERLESRPGYQFRLGEGAKQVEAGQAAQSGLLSGRAGKELTRYSQEFASGEFDKETRRLMDVVNIGRGAATTSSGAASSTGANISNIITNTGAQQANMQSQRYASLNNAIQGGMQNYLTYKMFQDAF